MTHSIITGLGCIAFGYCCGLLLVGYLIGKRRAVDLTREGSGNIGTTNTFRVLGKLPGIITLLCDILKVIFCVVVIRLVLTDRFDPEQVRFFCLLGGFGAVLGHDFPLYMHFSGGKGVASTTGLCLAVFPFAFPICLAVMLLTVWKSRYVSLGSLLASLVFFVQVLVAGILGRLSFEGWHNTAAVGIAFCAAALIWFRHRENIRRLRAGTENRFSFSGGTEKSAGKEGRGNAK